MGFNYKYHLYKGHSHILFIVFHFDPDRDP